MKKWLAWMLIALLAMSVPTVGLAEYNPEALKEIVAGNDRATIPQLSAEKATLSVWTSFSTSASTVISNYNDTACYKKLEELTNVHIDWLYPAIGSESEQYQLMIASSDLPDVIWDTGLNGRYPGGPEKGMDDGVFLRLNDLIDAYAPNYAALRSGDAEIGRQTITDAGNIVCIYCLHKEIEPPWYGPIVRADYLAQVGEAMPETIADWYRVLSKFKTELNVPAPLLFNSTGFESYCDPWAAAFGVGNEWFIDEGTVKYAFTDPGMKAYLTEMNKWYAEGLIDRDFITRDSTQRNAMMTNGEGGAWVSDYMTGIDTPLRALANEKDAAYEISAAPLPSINAGEDTGFKNYNSHNKGDATFVTSSCKTPELAVAWLDTAYSEEGYYLFNYGIEGESYVMVDGEPQFTDAMINDPDGLGYNTICWRYKSFQGPYLRNVAAVPPYLDEVAESMVVWDKMSDTKMMPLVSLTAEETETKSIVMTDIDLYKNTMVLKFIIGEESLEKFDDYVQQIERMGIAEIAGIEQAAYDRYMTR